MEGEASSRWQCFVGNPQNDPYFQRYPWAAENPKALFDQIGEDLSSPQRAIRTQGFWALVVACPEMTDILHERESRYPRWRERLGKDQKMVDEALWKANDVVTYLQGRLVEDAAFKVGGRHGKDPRPYVNTAIQRWREAARRRLLREVSLDAQLESPKGVFTLHDSLQDPRSLVENEAMDTVALQEWRDEFLAWGFDRKHLTLLEWIYGHDRLTLKAPQCLDVRLPARLRKQFSRLAEKAILRRDAAVLDVLLSVDGIDDQRMRTLRDTGWFERVQKALRPFQVQTLPRRKEEPPFIRIQPITRGLGGRPGRLYLISHPSSHVVRANSFTWLDEAGYRECLNVAQWFRRQVQGIEFCCVLVDNMAVRSWDYLHFQYRTYGQHAPLEYYRDMYSRWAHQDDIDLAEILQNLDAENKDNILYLAGHTSPAMSPIQDSEEIRRAARALGDSLQQVVEDYVVFLRQHIHDYKKAMIDASLFTESEISDHLSKYMLAHPPLFEGEFHMLQAEMSSLDELKRELADQLGD